MNKSRITDPMTVAERRVAKAIQAARESSIKHLARIQEARDMLGDDCSHPASERLPWPWTHDNGYGGLSDKVGWRCQLCDKKDLWNPPPNQGV